MKPTATGPGTDAALRLLVVEDDEMQAKLLKANLARAGRLEIQLAHSADDALGEMYRRMPDAVLADVNMPGKGGIALVREIRAFDPSIPVLLMTIGATMDLAIEGIRAGATEFLQKPIDVGAFLALLDRAIRERPVREALQERPDASERFFVGSHPQMDELRRFAEQVARVPNARVLITGESGTGKSLLARSIHELSACTGRLVEINCAALPLHLLETELFGNEKGAFTDARGLKRGLIELADRGTLFLDEIGALPLELQGKLLTFLDGRGFRRIGGTEDLRVATRVITATNEDLRRRVRERTFREDLFYRLDIASIEVPSLRQMPSIIPDLVERFVAEIADSLTRATPPIDPGCIPALIAYPWPGNMRELRNSIERALIFHGAGPLYLRPPGNLPLDQLTSPANGLALPTGLTLEEVERRYLESTIQAMEGTSLGEIADRLGISRKTLWDKRRRYGI